MGLCNKECIKTCWETLTLDSVYRVSESEYGLGFEFTLTGCYKKWFLSCVRFSYLRKAPIYPCGLVCYNQAYSHEIRGLRSNIETIVKPPVKMCLMLSGRQAMFRVLCPSTKLSKLGSRFRVIIHDCLLSVDVNLNPRPQLSCNEWSLQFFFSL